MALPLFRTRRISVYFTDNVTAGSWVERSWQGSKYVRLLNLEVRSHDFSYGTRKSLVVVCTSYVRSEYEELQFVHEKKKLQGRSTQAPIRWFSGSCDKIVG